ncbi:MAG TPA: CoA transferase [Candidatus Dormibacteraeota bacterium]|nr:CoA transferase [Candidatus Dormibacteraeota bacterium]
MERIVIVDLTHVAAGPYGAMLLADAGARVIKVEPPEGEIYRSWVCRTPRSVGSFRPLRDQPGVNLEAVAGRRPRIVETESAFPPPCFSASATSSSSSSSTSCWSAPVPTPNSAPRRLPSA